MENETPSGSGDDLERRLEEMMRRQIQINVNQAQAAPAWQPVVADVYPGIGLWHLVHLVLTLMTGIWLIVWILHPIIAWSKWNREHQARIQAAQQRAREDQS